MTKRTFAAAIALTVGFGFVTPPAVAADQTDVVDSIVGGVLEILDVDASDELVSDLAAGLTPDVFDPALVADVTAAIDSGDDAAAAVARAFDANGDGEITGQDVAAAQLLAHNNWVALENVLASHGSHDDDDESDEDESANDGSRTNSSGAGAPRPAGSRGNSESNPSNNSDDDEPDDDEPEDGEEDESDDDEGEEDESDDDEGEEDD